MNNAHIFAYIYCGFTAVVICFQFALALGAPWGELAMGGKYPGQFPVRLRVAALVQIGLLLILSVVVLTRAGMMFSEYYSESRFVIWIVVIFYLVGAVLNAITPSEKERMLWLPVCIGLVICVSFIAIS